MSRIEVIIESIQKALKDENRPWTKYFTLVENKTGIDRVYLFVQIVICLVIYLLLGVGQQLVCNLIGFVYPAYCSLKALETSQKEDDTKWLTYWVIFALFTLIEFFSNYILALLPFYWVLKCFFYVWLMAPTEYNGSLLLYRRIIRPKFLQYQPQLDKLISTTKETAIKVTAETLLSKKQD